MSFRPPGPARPPGRPALALVRWPRLVLPVIAALVGFIILVGIVAGIWTDWLWFSAVHYSSVFGITYGTRWAMFFVAGLFMALVTGANALLAYRLRPIYRPVPTPGAGGDSYRLAIDPHRRLLLAVLLAVIGVISGVTAAGAWRTWLLFINQVPFHVQDPQFHQDLSFFVFTYPFIRLVLGYLFWAVLLSLVLAALVHYLYGGLRMQGRHPRVTVATQAHLFVLFGSFVLLKAVAYWVDRYGIDFSQRGAVTTGASYTDVNAVLPAKTVLAVIALLCAGLFFAGSVRRSATAPALGFGLLVLSAVLVGGVYPLVIEQFVVKPNELATESPYLAREIAATRQAYGVAGAKVIAYPGRPTATAGRMAADVAALPAAPVIDPAAIARAFRELQQVAGYYQFPAALSVDRYLLPGAGKAPQDLVVAVRGLPDPPRSRATWVNTHLVYTHGFGFVAARVDSAQPSSGLPLFVEAGLPPQGLLSRIVGRYQPRVYFGPQQNGYVIVGAPPGQPGQELDYPFAGGQRDFAYTGGGGVPIGSLLRRLAYAVKFSQLDIALSGAVGRDSRILYIRQPLARVAKVAPFLSLDANPYPVVADHRILWVVDGYTTTRDYPYSQRIGLGRATATSQSPGGSIAGYRPGPLNYLRNSVKAVVDAYTGAVTLYQWAPDPLLRAWMKAFPGLIKPRRDVPGYLLRHLRYPQAQFEVQQQILATYHVTGARSFYAGQGFWSVPPDPVASHPRARPAAPWYLTLRAPGYRQPRFSLAGLFAPRGRPDLAALMAVDSDPSRPGYGTIELLEMPQQATVAGPSQVRSAFEALPRASAEIAQWRRGGAAVTAGSLVAVPVDGGVLYVEPVYVSASAKASAGSYPTLQRVFAYVPGAAHPLGYGATLADALAQILAPPSVQQAAAPARSASARVRRDLALAERCYARAQAALAAADWAAYDEALAKMKRALDDARRAAQGVAGPQRHVARRQSSDGRTLGHAGPR